MNLTEKLQSLLDEVNDTDFNETTVRRSNRSRWVDVDSVDVDSYDFDEDFNLENASDDDDDEEFYNLPEEVDDPDEGFLEYSTDKFYDLLRQVQVDDVEGVHTTEGFYYDVYFNNGRTMSIHFDVSESTPYLVLLSEYDDKELPLPKEIYQDNKVNLTNFFKLPTNEILSFAKDVADLNRIYDGVFRQEVDEASGKLKIVVRGGKKIKVREGGKRTAAQKKADLKRSRKMKGKKKSAADKKAMSRGQKKRAQLIKK